MEQSHRYSTGTFFFALIIVAIFASFSFSAVAAPLQPVMPATMVEGSPALASGGSVVVGAPAVPTTNGTSPLAPVAAGAPEGVAAPAASAAQAASREIVVSATRTEREVFEVPASVAVVGAEQMEHEPKGTIAQQLQDIPGVQVTDGGIGGGAKRVSIRGESGARVLVLIDGMKISEQKSMDGSMIMVDPLNVERIEVIKGPASVLYGSEAIGGVINIITKKGGSRPLQGTLAATWDGSNNSLTPYASLYGNYNGFSYRISGDYTDAGDKIGGSGRVANSSYMQRNWSVYLDYTSGNGKVGGGYDHYWSSNNIPTNTSTATSTIVYTRPGMGNMNLTGPATVRISLDLPKWERDRYYLFAELENISDLLRRIKFTPFIQKTRKDFSNSIEMHYRASAPSPMPPSGGRFLFNQDLTQLPWTSNEQTSYGANLQSDWTFGSSHYVIGGLDYLYDALDAYSDTTVHMQISIKPNDLNPGVPWVNQTVNSATHFTYKGNQQTLAAYAQDEWSFHPDWSATLGLRATWIQSQLSEASDPRLEEKTDHVGNLVSSLGFVYSGLQDWRLRAIYSQGYRNPSLNLLYIGTAHGNDGYNYPNPDLKPETSDNFEIGARYDAYGVQADLSLFYALAKNYIAVRSKPGSRDHIFDNMNSARTHGAELTLGYTYAPWMLTPYVSGSYARRSFDRGGDLGRTSRTGLPEWNGRSGLRYEWQYSPKVNFYADAYGRFAAGSKEDLDDGNVSEHSGWGTANLALGSRFGKDDKVFTDLNLNNLFNKHYVPAASSLEDPGFNAVLRLGLDF